MANLPYAAIARFGDSHESPRNDALFLDSCKARIAIEVMAKIIGFKRIKRGSIFDEKSGLCSHEQGNRTDSSLTKRVASLPDLSHPAGCKALAEAKKTNAHS